MPSRKLILPDQYTQRPVASIRQGKENASRDEVVMIATDMVGPVAMVQMEMIDKIARLEDAAGITDETVKAEEAAGKEPKGIGYPVAAQLKNVIYRLERLERMIGELMAGGEDV